MMDSSGWIEFFTDGRFSAQYSKYFKDTAKIITPSIVLYEVYKKVKKERTEEDALLAVSLMNKTKIISLNPKNAFGFYFSGQTQDLSQRQGKAGRTKRSILF
ncbi:MAG: type II toxin-antitoxin system VapC family toxin [Deltaproteobacteria bacterium]|nr:type II toxin-antitoxin system VapC family toxin [Deltaproteobacteria bacterium]